MNEASRCRRIKSGMLFKLTTLVIFEFSVFSIPFFRYFQRNVFANLIGNNLCYPDVISCTCTVIRKWSAVTLHNFSQLGDSDFSFTKWATAGSSGKVDQSGPLMVADSV